MNKAFTTNQTRQLQKWILNMRHGRHCEHTTGINYKAVKRAVCGEAVATDVFDKLLTYCEQLQALEAYCVAVYDIQQDAVAREETQEI